MSRETSAQHELIVHSITNSHYIFRIISLTCLHRIYPYISYIRLLLEAAGASSGTCSCRHSHRSPGRSQSCHSSCARCPGKGDILHNSQSMAIRFHDTRQLDSPIMPTTPKDKDDRQVVRRPITYLCWKAAAAAVRTSSVILGTFAIRGYQYDDKRCRNRQSEYGLKS